MTAPKTILFINPWNGTIGPNVGMSQLAVACIDRGHRVVMAVGRNDDYVDHLRRQGVEAHVIPGVELTRRSAMLLAMVTQWRQRQQVVRRAEELCRTVAADAVCVNSENMLRMPSIGPRNGRRTVVIVRGARFAELGLLARIFFSIQRRGVWRYVAVSRTVQNLLLSVGIPDDQVKVICNGVDVNQFQPTSPRPGLREELGIPADAPVFGDVSIVLPRKGAHHLVEVLHHVRRTMPRACCLLIGAPGEQGGAEYVQQIRRRAQELGVSDGLILAGNRRDVHDVLKVVDVLLHPSETESFGRALAEAMATGIPVVGFDVGAVGELIDDGLTGYVIKPFDVAGMADATKRLLSDALLRRQFGQAGREKVLREYDLERNIAALVDLLESACAASTAALVPSTEGK